MAISPRIARPFDAAGNRAREALRTMEDIARFSLDDQGLCARLKDLRHGLKAALDSVGIDRAMLLASRDTQGDVGTGLTGAGERTRQSLADVAAAAGSRLTEALRSLEELAKAAGAQQAAAELERLRYAAYTADKELGLALATGRGRQWTLCVLITQELCTRLAWERVAEGAIAGGADCLQLREKSMDAGELLARARALVALSRGRAAVIINDRPDVALASGADGVHLGQSDLPIGECRRIVGAGLLIGVSTANMEQARRAAAGGADYCGCGPMYATTTKHKPVLSGPEYMRAYLADPATSRVPHLAISGITPERARELAAAGCRGVAVSSYVCGSDEPEAACRALVSAVRGGAGV